MISRGEWRTGTRSFRIQNYLRLPVQKIPDARIHNEFLGRVRMQVHHRKSRLAERQRLYPDYASNFAPRPPRETANKSAVGTVQLESRTSLISALTFVGAPGTIETVTDTSIMEVRVPYRLWAYFLFEQFRNFVRYYYLHLVNYLHIIQFISLEYLR